MKGKLKKKKVGIKVSFDEICTLTYRNLKLLSANKVSSFYKRKKLYIFSQILRI